MGEEGREEDQGGIRTRSKLRRASETPEEIFFYVIYCVECLNKPKSIDESKKVQVF